MDSVKFFNSLNKVLQLIVSTHAVESNGASRLLQILFYYYWPSSGGGTAPSTATKSSIVTTAVTGFKAVVVNPLLAILNARWAAGGIIQARWLDNPKDAFATVASGLAVGSIGTVASGMPLDNHVTVRKLSGIRGKHYKGNWKIPCLDTTYVTKDELNAGTGQAAWSPLKTPLYASISDGTTTMQPCIFCPALSQIAVAPTAIEVAPLGLAGGPACLINATVGENKRRKERPSVTF